MRDIASVAVLLRQVSLLDSAPDAEVLDLADQCLDRRLDRGDVLFRQGDRADTLYVVRTGRMSIFVDSVRGDELVLAVLGPADSFGELSLLDDSPRSAGARALDPTELVCVPAPAVVRLLQTSPTMALAVAQQLAALLRLANGASADLVFLDLPRRLAKLLVSGPGSVDGLAQAQVATLLGVGRQTLNQALQRFVLRGWVDVRRTGVAVLDETALRRFALS